MNFAPFEKLRSIWTPERELDEFLTDLSPQTELDSMIRDVLHRVIQQRGPAILDMDVLNVGVLRWEIIHHQPAPGVKGQRQISIWVEPN